MNATAEWMVRTMLGLLASAMVVVPAFAQDTAVVTGDRIRLVATPGTWTAGIVAAQGADALTVRVPTGSGTVPVPWTEIRTLQVRRPRTRWQGAVHGAKWGMVVGVVLAGVYVVAPPPDAERNQGEELFDALVGMPLTGALVGAIVPGSRWRAVSVADARRAASVLPSVARLPEPARAPTPTPSYPHPVGATPLAEFSVGANFPQSRHAQFPGLLASLGINTIRHRRFGASIVGEGDLSLFRPSVMGGARIHVRSEPLFRRGRTLTGFVQLVAGAVHGQRSGVVYSVGGSSVQTGVGIDYGSGVSAFRMQFDHRRVPDGVVFDERVPGGPVERLTGERIALSYVYRIGRR